MFNLTGVVAQIQQQPSITIPDSTLLYLKGDALVDLSNSPKSIYGSYFLENTITFDATDSIYDSGSSMAFPSFATDPWRYGARIVGLSLGNSTFTIESWIKNTGNQAGMEIFMWGKSHDAGTTSFQYQPILSTFGGNFSFWQSGSSLVVPIEDIRGTWYHLAVCRQGDNRIKIFRDGNQISDQPYNFNNSPFDHLYLGNGAFAWQYFPPRSTFKLAHFHVSNVCWYTSNFTANKATAFS